MKRLLSIIAVVITALWLSVSPVLATALPDSTPAIIDKWIWRNVLETGDMLVVVYENTPYATTPTDFDYSEAFVWRFFDTDGTTELAQALGYDYNENGYGYNVIGFYFAAADAPAWDQNYFITLSGTPAAFATPPTYTFEVTSSDYSSLTAQADVQVDIAARVLLLGADLDNKWGLTVDTSLLSETETGTVLSIYGEAFFRGALYGLQAYAPNAFALIIGNIATDYYTNPGTAYSTNLTTRYAGTPIETGITAGQTFFGTSWNIAGLLGTLAIVATFIGVGWYISKGQSDFWVVGMNGIPVIIIMTSMAMFDMALLGFVAAVLWIFLSAKIWKVV